MTATDLVFTMGIALFFQCIILYWIISSATRANKKQWHQELQLRLLARIAEKLGVSQDEIDHIFGKRKKG